ncbi:unnamed protein product [Symbiodinium sp. CCMP2592]|nr:unnamed protein product [Symbiodinium sp. CCMP2592]
MGLFESVAATEWVFHFFSDEPPGCSVNDAWIASLVKSGDFLAQQSTGRLVMVVAAARFACLVWEVTVQHDQNGESCFLCKPDGNAVHWQFLVDVQDWLLVPATPILLSDKGPIAWKRSADAMSLPQALCLQGCAINKEQLLQLIKQLNGTPPKGASKRRLQEFLIEHVLSPAEQAVALQQFQTATSAEWEDEVDSQFSEIISELDKDEANSGDIKEYVNIKKKGQLQLKRKFKAADQELKELKKQARSRGRGKGRGKGSGKGAKAKAKAKAKDKGLSFFERSLRRQRNKAAGAGAAPAENAGPAEIHAEPSREEVVGPPLLDQAKPSSSSRPEGTGEPAASSSSRAAGPGELEPPAQVLPGLAQPAERASFIKVNKSPDELLGRLAPPRCTFGLNHQDRRWTSQFKFDTSHAPYPYSQRTKSRSFAKECSWQEALREVHAWNWRKWSHLKNEAPLEAGDSEQIPGQMPADVMQDLQVVVDKLPEMKKYGRK